MKPSCISCALALILSSFVHAQVSRSNVSTYLGFEGNGVAGFIPPGWHAVSNDDLRYVGIDDQIAHTGSKSVRIRRDSASFGAFSQLALNSLPIDFAGTNIEIRAYIKTQDVVGIAAMYVREDDAGGNNVAFASTQTSVALNGTKDWAQYSINIRLIGVVGPSLTLGFLLNGTGTAWADDFQILVDGRALDASTPGRPPSVLETDKEFDAGSKVAVTSLSDTQVKNLVKLAKVWGFLKYHHPAVTSGQHHWDYELFRVLPRVLSASDNGGANAAIATWANSFGPVKQCAPCASMDSATLHLAPSLEWISDENALGATLSQLLKDVYKNRPNDTVQFYAMLNSTQGSPIFTNESFYLSLGLPDAGYQLLGLFRAWNMVQYFYPYRDLMGGDPAHSQEYWDGVLQQAIPRVAAAADLTTYKQEMTHFMAGVNDTQANVVNANQYRPPFGNCELPVELRWAEGKVVVGRYASLDQRIINNSNLQAGDVIESLDGVAVGDLIARWRPFYGASNDAAFMRDVIRQLTRGSCGVVPLVVRRGGAVAAGPFSRVNPSFLNGAVANAHDRTLTPATAAYDRPSNDVAYIKMSNVRAADIPGYIRSAAGSKGLILDFRNTATASEFVGYTFGSAFASSTTTFAKFLTADPANPGAYFWAGVAQIVPADPHYSGRVILLVDELTQGLGEFTAMTVRSVPGVTVIGSGTAGAGDFYGSSLPMPAGVNAVMSGTGLFYSDGRALQRTGIVPDIVVTPTVAGIAAGRDEPLEEAMRQAVTPAAVNTPKITLVANAESNGPAIAPNTWVMIKGTNLAPEGHTRIWKDTDFVNGTMPAQLDGVSVTINGKSAHMYYISPTQINVLAPTDAIDGQVQVVVMNNGVASEAYIVQGQAISPSFFYVGSGQYILAQHGEEEAHYALVGPVSMSVPGYPFTPAEPGKPVILYGNGFGPTSSPVVNGASSQSGILDPKPTLTIGGVAASVDWAGLISPGLYQLNVTVPASLADGEYPVLATHKGVTTQTGLMITVKQ